MTERYLEGTHAVVTGGSRGIGAAIATSLGRRGASLTLMARSSTDLADRAAAVERATDARVHFVACDVTNDEEVAAAFARACGDLGPVHVLVNNAGAGLSARFTAMTRETWDHMLAVNLTAAFACTAHVLPAMLEAKSGRIVNIASTAGLRGYKTMTAYCAAKHGLVGLTRALALETAKYGVTVNAVCPGYTDTAMADQAIANVATAYETTREEARTILVRTIPRGSMTTPEEVASAVAWLSSPDAAAVTGIALPIAGGEVS